MNNIITFQVSNIIFALRITLHCNTIITFQVMGQEDLPIRSERVLSYLLARSGRVVIRLGRQ